MNQLTNRLKAIALEINQGETMADIGTDHGFLPLFLWQSGKCPKVIMTDVSQGSLQKAIDNCEKEQPGKLFDCRLGDGLQVVGRGEVDTVVIAGMGGILISEIMGEDLEKTKTFPKFILQPRSAIGELRHWLFHHGFSIEDESLVRKVSSSVKFSPSFQSRKELWIFPLQERKEVPFAGKFPSTFGSGMTTLHRTTWRESFAVRN